MLRAYVDESGSGDANGIFTIAGYVGFAGGWCDFTKQWAAALAAPPTIPYFRAASLRDKEWRAEHRLSWEDATAKVAAVEPLLHDSPHILFSSIVTVTKDQYRDIVGPEAKHFTRIGKIGKTWLKTPYNYLFQHFVRFTLHKVHLLGICGDQVDFVFDHNDALFDDANALLRWLRNTMPEPYQSMLGDAIPGNDKKCEPLQAADLFAGRVKDYCMSPKDKTLEESLRYIAGKGDRNITVHAKARDLNRFAKNLAAEYAKNQAA